jgi:nicotinamide-nucleotide amidase
LVHNPHGTAPGIDMEVARDGAGPCRVFALPGVPAEMRQMWDETLAGALGEMAGPRRVIRRRTIKCFGAGESQVEQMLPDLIRRGRRPTVGINASRTTIILRVVADGATEAECDAAIEPTVATIRDCLGTLVYGEGDDELQDAVVRLLRDGGHTLATAEWGTAGLVTRWLDTAEGAVGHFLGGVVLADEAALASVLDLSPELLARDPAVGGEAVAAMAEGCRRRFLADYSLAIGRLPPPRDEADATRRVLCALAGPEETVVKKSPYVGHPAVLEEFCAKRALNLVRLALMGETP